MFAGRAFRETMRAKWPAVASGYDAMSVRIRIGVRN
jgi:hypothetical protein